MLDIVNSGIILDSYCEIRYIASFSISIDCGSQLKFLESNKFNYNYYIPIIIGTKEATFCQTPSMVYPAFQTDAFQILSCLES